jgi:hypothetical protein
VATRIEKRARDFDSPESARAYAQSLRKLARDHKRESEKHKRAARRLMEQFEQFTNDLEALGIRVIIEPTPSTRQSPGGTSDTGPRYST